MLFEDFDSKDYLINHFNQLVSYTKNQLRIFDLNLKFSSENNLRISSSVFNSNQDTPIFEIEVSENLINLISRFFFCISKVILNIGDKIIHNDSKIEIEEPFFGEIDSLERYLNSLPDDSFIHDSRVDIFIMCLSISWDWLLIHELAHITHGHLLFSAANKSLVDGDPSFSLAMEAEADDWAATCLMQMKMIDSSNIDSEVGTPYDIVDLPYEFVSLVISALYLVIRVQPSTIQNSTRYLPNEIRHALAVINIISRRENLDQQTKNEAFMSALTKSTELLMLITGKNPPPKPTIYADIPLEKYAEYVEMMQKKHSELSHHWQSYRMQSAKT